MQFGRKDLPSEAEPLQNLVISVTTSATLRRVSVRTAWMHVHSDIVFFQRTESKESECVR